MQCLPSQVVLTKIFCPHLWQPSHHCVSITSAGKVLLPWGPAVLGHSYLRTTSPADWTHVPSTQEAAPARDTTNPLNCLTRPPREMTPTRRTVVRSMAEGKERIQPTIPAPRLTTRPNQVRCSSVIYTLSVGSMAGSGYYGDISLSRLWPHLYLATWISIRLTSEIKPQAFRHWFYSTDSIVEYDACDLSPCLNGGTCHIQVGGYWCECPYGYMGSLQCHATTAPPPPPPPTYGGKTHYTTALPTTTYSPDYNAACPSVAGYGGFRACRSVCSPDYECGRGEVCCPNACGGSYCYRLPTQGYNRMSNYGPSPLSGDYGSASPIGGLSGLQYLVGNPKKTAIGLLNPHVNINNLKDPSYLLSTYGDGN